ncbi:MAG TPA: tRNA (adenosine(37)-N6)-threonylcarbamoyltransferase complex dimerization subunit type 1 TsaB [Chitinophagaceae bacterium]
MSLILTIDTAIDTASICLADEGRMLSFRKNDNQKEQAEWIHIAIQEVMKDGGYTLHDLKAIAVINGPGSYTGLRIGLSTAKGLCYALNIPLITVGSLELMAVAAKNQLEKELANKKYLLCPMIDARRMEVYTALYDTNMTQVLQPQAMLLQSGCFSEIIQKEMIVFFGNGSEKFRNIFLHPNAVFVENIPPRAVDISGVTFEYYMSNRFADLAYAEPLYIKDVFITSVIK